MLEKILKALDLTKDEARIYALLLETNASTAGVIAKKVGLLRPTVYNLLHRMRDKGVVTQSIKRGVRTFHAESPRKLENAFNKRIQILENNRTDLLRILPDLERCVSGFLDPKLQIFEGPEGLRNIMMDVWLYHDIETWSFWPVKEIIDLLGEEFMHRHNIERICNRIYIKGIWPQSKQVELKRYPFMGSGPSFFREIRIAPPQINFSMSYWIYASKVAFLSSHREAFGFVVESLELAELLKTQHQFIWNFSKPLTVKAEHVRPFLDDLKSAT